MAAVEAAEVLMAAEAAADAAMASLLEEEEQEAAKKAAKKAKAKKKKQSSKQGTKVIFPTICESSFPNQCLVSGHIDVERRLVLSMSVHVGGGDATLHLFRKSNVT